jgi:hypothetical protein
MSVVLPIEPDSRFRQYTASAGQTQFAIPFPFQQEDDVAVMLLQTSQWVEIDASLYNIAGAEDPTGGAVNFATGRSAGDVIGVLGRAILDRLSSIVRDGRFSSRLTDDEFDRNRIIQQEQQRDIDRSLKVAYGGNNLLPIPFPDPGKPLIWRTDGLGLANGAETYNGLRGRVDQEVLDRIAGDNALRALIAANHSVSTAYVDTLGGAKLVHFPPTYRSVVTAGYDQAGDGGIEVWSWVASEPPHDMKWQSADGAWWEPAGSTVRAESIGAKLNGFTDCAPPINAALSYIAYRGGGTVLLGQGTALCRNTNPGAGSWANMRAIAIMNDHVRLRGSGGTILKLADGETADLIQVGQRVETIITVKDVIISDIEIDGNRDNVPLPGDDENHWSGITVSSGCSRVHLHDMYIHDCQYYAIGMQRDALINCSIRRVKCYNTGADAIDWKDDTATGHGNVVDEIDIENFGLATGLLTGQAGLDLRSGVTATNIHVKGFGPMATVGIRLQVGTAGEVPYQVSTLKDFKVTGTNIANTQGVRAITRYAQIAFGKAQGIGGDGFSISEPDVRISNCIAEANNAGFRLWQDAAAGLEADTNTYVGLVSRNNTQAGIIVDSVDEVSFMGCDVRNNTGIGYDIRTGSTAIRIIGGSCTGNGTNVNDVDGIATISNVSGLRTEQHLVLSASIDVSTTGLKTFTFNHSLAFTPSLADVNLNLVRGTLDGNLQISGLMVSAVSSSQIIGAFRVVVAAAAGITMQVACFARVKTG